MANEKKGLVDITTGAEVADANANGILDLTPEEVSYVAAGDQSTSKTSDVEFNRVSVNVNGALESAPPKDCTFYATYDKSIDGDYGLGTLTCVPTGGASVLDGVLDLAYADLRYGTYSAVGNADSQQVGAIKFKYASNYGSIPPFIKTIFVISRENGDNRNLISLLHSTTARIFLSIYDETGVAIMFVNLGAWLPTTGVYYEFELNWDITTGATRLFINGVQFGTTQIATGVRDSNIGLFRIGSETTPAAKSDFKIDDLIVYNSVQHTTDYTPGYSLDYFGLSKDKLVALGYIELNKGATTITEFSNDPDESVNLDKKLWTIEAIKGHVSSDMVHDVFAVSAGQTSFTLSEEAYDATAVILSWQGQICTYGATEDFTISGTTLTWNDKEGALEAEADLQAWYFTNPTALSKWKHETLIIDAPGKTSFTLVSTPSAPTHAMLVAQGQICTYGAGEDFTISGNTLTWNEPDGWSFETANKLQIWFW